jgi:BMFP domain-containing protein YqiC
LVTVIFAGIVARVYPALFAQEIKMQSQNRIFDDLAKVAGGALSTLTALKEEIEAMVRDRFQRAVADADFVRREEFEAVKAVASAARTEQEKLEARVAALEAQLNAKK